MKKLFLILTLLCSLGMPFTSYSATQTDLSYTTLRTIDTGTFNEYRYKITEQFFNLRDRWQIDGELHQKTLEQIGVLADAGYKYLPDNLQNKNLLKKLLTDLQRGVKFPNNDANYTEIIKSIGEYLDNVSIESIKGTVQASPSSGNAPLNVTLRGAVTDPTGTQIPAYNYTWWIDNGGQRVVIGRGISLNYTFREEGNFSVFLDVTSNHKNSEGNIDVLPFRSRADIQVNEKIASLIIKVNGDNLRNSDVLKYNPTDARFGLLFDATSSTPTGGAKFTRTEWDFGNGVIREYNGVPRVERVVYAKEGDYTVSLKLRTNESKVIERKFVISINDPIATISTSKDDGFIGDKFTFTAKPSGNDRNLSYAWEVVDIDNDEIIMRKSDKVFSYTFLDKGKYNVRLRVTQASGETDIDTRIIYINSQAPIAEFTSKIPLANKPNRVFLDASRSFDPDFSDDGRLTYTWFIDGERVNLEDANSSGSVGYYVFDSVGSHDVSLEVRDPDNIVSLKKSKVEIDSILSVEMFAFPRVIQRESFIRFVAESPEAEIFEWDFGDGTQKGGSDEAINHTFNKSGAFDVRLRVRDADNKQNTFTKTVYVAESDTPVAILDISSETELLNYSADACNGSGGYSASRISTLKLDANESIDIDGDTSGLEYTWKIGNSKFATSATVNHKFDEIGCFPIKLTVKSQKNGRTSTRTINVDVQNQLPTVSALGVDIQNEEADPLVVTVTALGAKDPDGIIQSYLWYYYTDTDTEPQDFRSSTKPSTTFVLPKITGQYYFVVIMKDNNEARINSEQATGSRFFTTVTGDNINTPLVDLSVNDTAVSIGDEVVFSTQVRDILGQDIGKNSTFSWDFDGDGFYDIEGKDPSISYKYKKSGTFYAKVKVKHKGISTTRTITMNVSNNIVPDFEYISIGNKYVFFDTSNGEVDSREWDLGDGTKVSGKTFVHEYTDKKSTHNVTLKVSEGTRTKEVEKRVIRNVKNVLAARGDGLNLFTIPAITSTGGVVLENDFEKFYVYMGESNGDIASYAIDYDLDIDSDLNGGKDDDQDNKGTGSFTSGDILEIPLSPVKVQNIRIFLLAQDGSVIDSQDIMITKSYIEEQNTDLDSIEFLNVTQGEKEKIAQLKTLLSQLPQAQKLVAMSYIQRMQENWSDKTEKTRVIIEFETYLFDQDIENVDEIIQVLESLLVEGQEDTSTKNIAFTALKNLIPPSIVCTVEEGYETCFDTLVAKLETIRDSRDVEQNKTLGSSILMSIQDTDTMTNQQKIDFKAVLSSLVYGGLENIPEQEVEEVINTPQEDSGSAGGLIGILVIISYVLGGIFFFIVAVILIFFIWYKISSSGNDVKFQDFITQKTSKKSADTSTKQTVSLSENDTVDILADTPVENTPSVSESHTSTDIPDPLASVDTQEKDTSTPKPKPETTQESSEVPDWLAGNFSNDTQSDTQTPKDTPVDTPSVPLKDTSEQKQEVTEQKTDIFSDSEIEKETQIEEETIPDWLKTDLSSNQQDEEKIAGDDMSQKSVMPEDDLEQEVVPDWLQADVEKESQDGILGEKVTSPKTPKPVSENTSQDTVKEIPKDIGTPEKSSPSEAIPDWLKGSFDETPDTSKDVDDSSKTSQIDKADNTQPKKKPQTSKTPSQGSTTPEKKQSPKPEVSSPKTDKKDTPKIASAKNTTQKSSSASKKSSSEAAKKPDTKKESFQKKSTTSQKKDSELWDDGMKVPDWLKSSDE